MRGTILHRPGDVRYEDVPDPAIVHPTDAIIRLSATCICGSDLWPYRGLQDVASPMAMGHEYCGIVEEVGSAVTSVRPGQFVVGSFCISDNTCPHCRFGFPSSCVQREFMVGAQAPRARVPLADGTLVATSEIPSDDLVPSLLAVSDVLGTGWYAAEAANVKPGSTAVVVGDGAVGLMGVLAAKRQGATRIIAMSRHEPRRNLALEFGATDLVAERGERGIAQVQAMTSGVGADSVLECEPDGKVRKEAGCWAHARRYFFESAAVAKEPIAREALYRIRRVFETDARFWERVAPSKRKVLREQFLKPEIDAFFVFARAELEKVKDQRGLLRSALVYATRQESALRRVLEEPHLKLDNNASERALRKVAIGRKNWLFVGTDEHAQTTANLLSNVASAKLHDLEPEEYVRDLLRVLPHWPRDRYLELAPKYWRATRDRLEAAQLEAELGPLTIPEASTR